MNELPPGWVEANTDSLFTFVTSGSRGWARYYTDDGAPFIRVGNLQRGSITPDLTDLQRVSPPVGAEGVRTQVKSGDVLISITADLGRIALMADVKETTYINQHVALARPVKAINPRYVAWYLSSDSAQRQWGEQQRGVTRLGLGLEDIRSIKIPVPPLAEQGRIVAAVEQQFSRLEAGTTALQRVQQSLKNVRAAVLQAAVTGRLVPHSDEDVASTLDEISIARRTEWRAATNKPYREPAEPAAFPISIPKHWCIASLEAITDPVRVICYGILMPKEHIQSGIPYVRVKDMRDWTIDVAGLKRTSPEIAARYARASLRTGDLLLAIRGSYGRVAIIPPELDGGNITQDSARIAPHSYIDHRYLLYYLGGSVANRYYAQMARGVAVKGVNIGDLKSMPVPIPPRLEQEAIADEIERQFTLMNDVEATVQQQTRHSQSLRSSILSAAFSGRLVPQDPTDEPASVLLEQIGAERTSSNGRQSARNQTLPPLQREATV